MTVRTHTRTHVTISFANPYLRCDLCHQPAPRWHNNDKCGCTEECYLDLCSHNAEAVSVCPSWGPVDGCTCAAVLGTVEHDEEGRCPAVLLPVDRCLYPSGHDEAHLSANGTTWTT